MIYLVSAILVVLTYHVYTSKMRLDRHKLRLEKMSEDLGYLRDASAMIGKRYDETMYEIDRTRDLIEELSGDIAVSDVLL